MRLLTLAYSTDDYEGRPYVLITITREDAKKFIKRIRNAIRAKVKDNTFYGYQYWDDSASYHEKMEEYTGDLISIMGAFITVDDWIGYSNQDVISSMNTVHITTTGVYWEAGNTDSNTKYETPILSLEDLQTIARGDRMLMKKGESHDKTI